MTIISNPRLLLEHCRGMRSLHFACENVVSRTAHVDAPLFDEVRAEWLKLHTGSDEFPFNEWAIKLSWDFVNSMTNEDRNERLAQFDDAEKRILRDIDENGDGPRVLSMTIRV